MYDYAIVGGGIVGLATAAALAGRWPGCSILLLEKEDGFARHQTGHNSGVIHAGIYYKPGSLKAQLCGAGNRSMKAFCAQHGIPFESCGKLIVATEPEEVARLEQLFVRGVANGVPVERLSPEAVREIEPHVRCLAGLRVLSTGITSYRAVCTALVRTLQHAGAELRLATEFLSSAPVPEGHRLETSAGSLQARFLITCGGLQSDRLSRASGTPAQARIVPFRGEYYELKPERRFLVRHLVYPVANPNFPFLGVHFTRMIDGSVHAGPNAVLALKREGYQKLSFAPRDAVEVLTCPGFWRLAARYPREGAAEMLRSASKALFTRSLQRLVPEVRAEDLVVSEAGVRAQALGPDGSLVDDFLLGRGERALHVLNAPSPAATASLEIAKYIVAQVPRPGFAVGAARASAPQPLATEPIACASLSSITKR